MNRQVTAIALGVFAVVGSGAYGQGQQLTPSLQSRDIVSLVGSDGRVVLTNLGGGSPLPAPGPTIRSARATPYRELIDEISAAHGVDPELTEAVIEVESGFDPTAVSPKGALGLMQLIRATGERFGVNNFFDPEDNIRGGVRFLRFLIEKFDGNADLVLAAYNSGENRVERLGRIPAIPETIDYVQKVRRAWGRLRGGPVAGVTLPSGERNVSQVHPPPIYRIVGEGGVLKISNVGVSR